MRMNPNIIEYEETAEDVLGNVVIKLKMNLKIVEHALNEHKKDLEELDEKKEEQKERLRQAIYLRKNERIRINKILMLIEESGYAQEACELI